MGYAMDSQFICEDTYTHKRAGFMRDESDDRDFEEFVESNDCDEDSYTTVAIKGLDDSLCIIDVGLNPDPAVK
jgi:hypothetical protein